MKRKNETPEHKKIKEIMTSELQNIMPATLEEYPDAGHELDVFSVDYNGVKAVVEIIWTPSPAHFHKDINIILLKQADVKIVIASGGIMSNDKLKREFEKVRLAQIDQKVIMTEMFDGQKILSDDKYLKQHVLKQIKAAINLARSRRSANTGKLKDHYLRLREKGLMPILGYGKGALSVAMPHAPLEDLEFYYKVSTSIDPYYRVVLDNHLKGDLPVGVPSYADIEQASKKHQERVNQLSNYLEKETSKRLERVATIVNDFPITDQTIFLNAAMQILHNRWYTIRTLVMTGSTIRNAVKKAEPLSTVYPISHDRTSGKVTMGDIQIANLNEDQVRQFSAALDELMGKEKFLSRMRSLQIQKGQLDSKLEQFKGQVSKMDHDIEDERYDTVTTCCREVK